MSEPTPDINFENMEIKYLKQALASLVQPSTKAEVYSRYFEKCDFNTTLEPHFIIKFSEDCVRSMVGIGQYPDGAEEVRQFLIKSNTNAVLTTFKGNSAQCKFNLSKQGALLVLVTAFYGHDLCISQ